MAATSWNISGQYFETCSCDFVCPCILSQMTARPTEGSCTFAMTLHIERGRYGTVPLDGIALVVLGYTPEEMGKGHWSLGLVVDERANAEQLDAVTAIASGAAGGPMAPLSGLVGTFLGVERAPIQIERSGLKFTVKAGNLVDMAAEGQKGLDPDTTEPMFLENTGHPVSNRLALAHASKSHVHALGLAWDDVRGKNNGHFAPFNWQSA
jgi:hypothetical protein